MRCKRRAASVRRLLERIPRNPWCLRTSQRWLAGIYFTLCTAIQRIRSPSRQYFVPAAEPSRVSCITSLWLWLHIRPYSSYFFIRSWSFRLCVSFTQLHLSSCCLAHIAMTDCLFAKPFAPPKHSKALWLVTLDVAVRNVCEAVCNRLLRLFPWLWARALCAVATGDRLRASIIDCARVNCRLVLRTSACDSFSVLLRARKWNSVLPVSYLP